MKYEINKETKEYICPYCGNEYSKFGIKGHIWRAHEDGVNHKPFKDKIGWNKGLTKENDERINISSERLKKTMKDKKENGIYPGPKKGYMDDETKKEYSERMSNIMNYLYQNGREVSGGYTKFIEYKDIKVQGTYELRMCVLLDILKESEEILNWEYTKDRFKYKDIENKDRYYLLDFKVFTKSGFYYIEIKGFERENDKYKWEAVRKKGFRLDVLFNEDIKKLEKKLL